MKKTIALVSALAVVFCCSFPVFAVGQAQRRVTTSSWDGDPSVSGVYVSAVASQLYGYADVSNSGLTQHAGKQDVVVTVTLTNNNNNDVGIKGLYVRPSDNASTIRNINDFGVISGDISIGVNSPISNINATFSVSPNENSSYVGNGTLGTNGDKYLVIPAKKSFSFSFYYSTYYGSSASTDYVLSSIAVGCQKYITGDIPHGIAVDNSDVINALNDLLSDGNSDSVYDLVNRLYNKISSEYPDTNFVNAINSGLFWGQANNVTVNNNPRMDIVVFTGRPHLINANYVPSDISEKLAYSELYALDYYVTLRKYNQTSKTYNIDHTDFYFIFNNNVTCNADFVGSSYDVLTNNQAFYINWVNNSTISAVVTSTTFPSGLYEYDTYKFTYYYSLDKYSDNYDAVQFTYNAPTIAVGNNTFTVTENSQFLFASWAKNFADIRDRIQSILDSYTANQQGAEDVTESAESSSSTIDNQHQTESNYFSDSQSAIQDTGIQNFQFTPQESAGLNGLKDDFTAVWVSCGTLSRVWITSLTIGLALAIIRHRRMFEK